MARIKRIGSMLEGERRSLGKSKGEGAILPGTTYDAQTQEVPQSQLIRVHTSEEALKTKQKGEMERLADEYVSFLNKVEIDCDVVYEAEKIAKKRSFFNGKNIFMKNQEETSFGMVKFGKRPISEGMRIFVGHNNAPCLKIKSKPLLFEWDPDLRDLHLGVRIDTRPYGCPKIEQYDGSTVRIKGYVYPARTQRRKNICLDAYITTASEHIDDRKTEDVEFSEAHKGELLDLITGHNSKRELLEELKIEEDDFASARLYVVPPNKAWKMKNHYIVSYGQDARIGIFASMKAFHGIRNPEYTTILIGFDKEEANSGGTSGAKGKFLESIVGQAIKKELKIDSKDLTASLIGEIYNKSYAVDTDTDVGSTDRDCEREKEIIKESIGRIGQGVFILGQDGDWDSDQISTRLVARIRNIAIRNNIVSQVIDNPIPIDEDTIPTFGEYFTNRGIETLCISSVVGGLHSKEEISSRGDLYQTTKLYKAILRDKRPFTIEPKIIR
jgi:aspartyl aminopeptidase